MSRQLNRNLNRRGAVAVFFLFLLVPLLGLVALAVDYGYLLYVRTDLQRAADQAALAGVRDLIPLPDGTQDLGLAHATIQQYVEDNLDGIEVRTLDIEIGRYDPNSIYDSVTILNTGIFDTIKLTLRRDDLKNKSVSLFFARVLGIDEIEITATATAVLQKGRYMEGGADILPMSMPRDLWESKIPGDQWSIYGDGKIIDYDGSLIPGNWGTLDIGHNSNGSSQLADQIRNGLRQSDIDYLHTHGTIPSNTQIDGDMQMWLNGDTGLSTGIKAAVRSQHGETKLVPIYDTQNSSQGNNLNYHIIGWGVVEVIGSNWGGAQNTYVEIKKAYAYDGDLRPNPDLGNGTNLIEGAYTTPALVQ